MVPADFANDVAVWAVTFGFGSICTWLVWLTMRHYKYGKPAYDALAGGEMGEGHLEATDGRFAEIETSHEELRERVNEVERKVDGVDEKTDRNYRLLEKIATKAEVDGIFFRGGSSSKKSKGDD